MSRGLSVERRNRAAEADADAIGGPRADAGEEFAAAGAVGVFRDVVDRAADGAFAEHEGRRALQDFDAVEEKRVDGTGGLGGGVLADAVAEDGDVVAAETARGVSGDGAEVGAAGHADGGFDGLDGGAKAAELHHFLGDDGDARGQVAHGEAEAGAGGGGGVEGEGKVFGFVGDDIDAVEHDEVVLGGGLGRLRGKGGDEEEGAEGETERRREGERERHGEWVRIGLSHAGVRADASAWFARRRTGWR